MTAAAKEDEMIWYPEKYMPPRGTLARQALDAQEQALETQKAEREFQKKVAGRPTVGRGRAAAYFLGVDVWIDPSFRKKVKQ